MDTETPTKYPPMTLVEAERILRQEFPGTTEVDFNQEYPSISEGRPSATPGFDQFLADLFTTVMEGGCNYWASISSYRIWKRDSNGNTIDPLVGDLLGFSADLHNDEDEGDFHVNRRIMARGWRKLNAHVDSDPESPDHVTWRNKLAWSNGEKPPVVWSEAADWDYDAGDADCILQLGLLDSVVYG